MTQNKSLIDTTDELKQLFNEIEYLESNDMPVPSELADALSLTLTRQAEKVDRCVSFINRCTAEIEWLKSEKKVIDSQIKRIDSGVTRMKSLAKFVLESDNLRKITGLHGHSFSLRTSKSVVIEDETLIPGRFIAKKISYVPDKMAIKEALIGGEDVPGCRLDINQNVVAK